MTKKHQACHDINDLCAAILELLNDDSVQAAAHEIGATEPLSLLALAAENLQGRADVAHRLCLKEEALNKGLLH